MINQNMKLKDAENELSWACELFAGQPKAQEAVHRFTPSQTARNSNEERLPMRSYQKSSKRRRWVAGSIVNIQIRVPTWLSVRTGTLKRPISTQTHARKYTKKKTLSSQRAQELTILDSLFAQCNYRFGGLWERYKDTKDTPSGAARGSGWSRWSCRPLQQRVESVLKKSIDIKRMNTKFNSHTGCECMWVWQVNCKCCANSSNCKLSKRYIYTHIYIFKLYKFKSCLSTDRKKRAQRPNKRWLHLETTLLKALLPCCYP